MVDAERLRRVLQRVTDDLAWLRRYAARNPADLLADPAGLGHVKYLFVTALEGCIDAAHHVCASEGWGPPETNADAMAVLGRHGVLDEALTDAMAAAARFRNVLVRGYVRVDDGQVVAHLQRLDDLDRFVAVVAATAV